MQENIKPALFVKILSLVCCGNTFRGSKSKLVIFAALLNGSQHVKERICSFRGRLFPLRVDCIPEGLHHPQKQIKSHKSCSTL